MGLRAREALRMTQVMCWRVWVEDDVISQGGHWGLQEDKER